MNSNDILRVIKDNRGIISLDGHYNLNSDGEALESIIFESGVADGLNTFKDIEKFLIDNMGNLPVNRIVSNDKDFSIIIGVDNGEKQFTLKLQNISQDYYDKDISCKVQVSNNLNYDDFRDKVVNNPNATIKSFKNIVARTNAKALYDASKRSAMKILGERFVLAKNTLEIVEHIEGKDSAEATVSVAKARAKAIGGDVAKAGEKALESWKKDRRPTIGTLGVCYDNKRKKLVLYFNPKFIMEASMIEYVTNTYSFKSFADCYIYTLTFLYAHEMSHIIRHHTNKKGGLINDYSHQFSNMIEDSFINMSLAKLLRNTACNGEVILSSGIGSSIVTMTPKGQIGLKSYDSLGALAETVMTTIAKNYKSKYSGRNAQAINYYNNDFNMGDFVGGQVVIRFACSDLSSFGDNSSIYANIFNDVLRTVTESVPKLVNTSDESQGDGQQGDESQGDGQQGDESQGDGQQGDGQQGDESQGDGQQGGGYNSNPFDDNEDDEDGTQTSSGISPWQGDESQGDESQGDGQQGDGQQGDESQGDESQGDESQGDGQQGDESQGDESQGDESQGDGQQGDGQQGDKSQGDGQQGDGQQGDESQGDGQQGDGQQGDKSQGDGQQDGKSSSEDPNDSNTGISGDIDADYEGSSLFDSNQAKTMMDELEEILKKDSLDIHKEISSDDSKKDEGSFGENNVDNRGLKDTLSEEEKRKVKDVLNNVLKKNTSASMSDAEKQMLSDLGLQSITSIFKPTNGVGDWKDLISRLLDQALGMETFTNPDLPNKKIEDAPPEYEDDRPIIENILLMVDCSPSMGGGRFKDVIEHMSNLFASRRMDNVTFHIVPWGDTNFKALNDSYRRVIGDKTVGKLLVSLKADMGATDICTAFNFVSMKVKNPDMIVVLTDGEYNRYNGDIARMKKYINNNSSRLVWVFSRQHDKKPTFKIDPSFKTRTVVLDR